MIHYLIELILWLLLAFFIGAIIACLLRGGRDQTQAAAAREEEEAARRAAAERAAAEKAAAERAAAEKAAAERDAAEKAAAEKAAAEKAAAEKAAAEKAAAEKAAAPKPYGLAAPLGGKADNLTRIRGIGKQINGILNDLGIWHFSQIASWTEQDIAWVDERLKFKGRIEREEWVKQARLLAEGKETEFSRRVDSGQVPTSNERPTKKPGK